MVCAIAGIAIAAHGANEAFALTSRFELVQGFRLVALFFGAGALQCLAARVPLRGPLALLALAALVAAMAWGGAWHALYAPALSYLVVWAALVPGGLLRLYNRLGDYSYGFYLWQFPLQQWIVLRRPETTQPELILLSAPAALAVAALSWHFVESPALAWKERAPAEATR
jgi:peptidoglycan/LPS O-acetylase OafA/YrhL